MPCRGIRIGCQAVYWRCDSSRTACPLRRRFRRQAPPRPDCLPRGILPGLLALPARLPAGFGRARLPGAQPRNSEAHYPGSHRRPPALGAGDVLEADRRHARAHAAQRPHYRLVRAQGYRVEKVVYESRPRFHVSANLYIPTRDGRPFPGVLFQMGHSDNGKADGNLSALLPGAGAARLPGAGIRPHGAGRARSTIRTRAAPASRLVRRQRAHHARQADAAARRHQFASAGLGCDAQPGLPGVPSHGRSQAPGLHRAIRRRHAHHAADGRRRAAGRGCGMLRNHREFRLCQFRSARIHRRRRAGLRRLGPARFRPLGSSLPDRAQAPAGQRQRPRFLRHLLAPVHLAAAGRSTRS